MFIYKRTTYSSLPTQLFPTLSCIHCLPAHFLYLSDPYIYQHRHNSTVPTLPVLTKNKANTEQKKLRTLVSEVGADLLVFKEERLLDRY
jgi:hypothetical protein